MKHAALSALVLALALGSGCGKSWKDYHNRAIDRVNNGDYAGAFDDFRKAIELNPKSAESHLGLGWTLHEMDEYEWAIEEFDVALEIKPGLLEAYYNRGLSFYDWGRTNEALENFNYVLSVNSRHAGALWARGWAFQEAGDLDAAVADYEAALKHAPRKWPRRSDVEAALKQAKSSR